MNLLFVGDIVGRPGRYALTHALGRLVDRYCVDLVVVNGENAAAGFGLTAEVAREIFATGVDVITSGNHIWDKKEVFGIFEKESRLLRPGNYPPGLPGKGSGVFKTAGGVPIGVINLEGRAFMNNLDCPFRTADALLDEISQQTKIIFVDFHAETTSEKISLGYYLDGRISAMIGTHTHVQTADERILPGGTAYLTDVGMTGSRDSVIGIRKEEAIERFLTQLPIRFEVAKKDPWLCAALVTIDEDSGKAQAIERIQVEVA